MSWETIGNNLTVFISNGPGEGKLRKNAVRRTGDYRIDPKEWEKKAQETDKFLDNFMNTFQEKAAKKYGGEISFDDDYIRQSSARQGLKICSPDEYDVIVPVRFPKMELQQSKVRNADGKIAAGLNRHRVINKDAISNNACLDRLGIFQRQDGNIYLNAKNFQEKCLTSPLDQAIVEMNKRYPDCQIVRSIYPPTMNVKVSSPSGTVTNFDIVPAIELMRENITIPPHITGNKPWHVTLPIYGLPKHVNKQNTFFKEDDKPLIWRFDTSSHERCMADLCNNIKERQYIMTANCILKAAIRDLEKQNNPLSRVINSYHLKTLAYNVVFKKTMGNCDQNSEITGVKDALGYQISELRNCLQERCLHDFFLGNKALEEIFPGSILNQMHRRQNLFWKIHPQLLLDALRHGFSQLLDYLSGLYTCYEGLG